MGLANDLYTRTQRAQGRGLGCASYVHVQCYSNAPRSPPSLLLATDEEATRFVYMRVCERYQIEITHTVLER